VAKETEQQKARESKLRSGRKQWGAREERLIGFDDEVVGGDGWAACSLLVQTIVWEFLEQQAWQRLFNATPHTLLLPIEQQKNRGKRSDRG